MITYDTTEAPQAQQDPAPVTRVYASPRQQVERVDALSCKATAIKRIGDHCVCAEHEREVRLAYWATDANLILHNVLPSEYFECGDVYTSPEVTR